MVEAREVTHLTFEDEPVLCILLANLGQQSYLGTPRLWAMTHVCVLPEQGVLLPKLWFSILIILVQAPLLGHAPTAIPPTQCAFMMVSISVLTPSTTLQSNG
jgi:hypothetical protein